MPSFNIHLAVAKQYIVKHKDEIQNQEEFFLGGIKPDTNEEMTGICEDKSQTHYGMVGCKEEDFKANIKQFLNDEKVDITTDFYKGYILHLLTDYYFYTIYFKDEFMQVIQNNDDFYYDYDCLDKILEDKFDVELPKELKKFINYKNGKPKYLNIDKIMNFIEECSNWIWLILHNSENVI